MLYVAAVSATRDGAEWIRSECEKYHIALSYCECVAEEELDGVLSELEKEADLLICDAEFCEGRNIKLPVLRIDTAGDEERFLSEVVARMLDRVEALQKQDARMQALRRCHFNGVIEIDEKRRILAISKVATKLLNCWGKMLKGEDLLNVISTLGEDVVDTVLRDGQRVFTLITAPDKSSGSLLVNIEPIRVGRRIQGAFITLKGSDQSSPFSKANNEGTEGSGAHYQFELFRLFSGDFSRLVQQAKIAAYMDAPVLIYGEEGNEQQEIAQSIHNSSSRRNKGFLEMDCRAMRFERQSDFLFGDIEKDSTTRQSLIERFDGGTLFLNHVEKLAPEVQYQISQLLKGLPFFNNRYEQITANVRIIAAAGENLWPLVREGAFRDDLYYALSVCSLHIPPLRERKDDLDAYTDKLFDYYGGLYNKPVYLSSGVYNVIREYDWPGNARQLESFCQSVVLATPTRTISEAFVRSQLGFVSLPEEGTAKSAPSRDRVQLELMEALERNNGNRQKTAEELGISTTTLWRRMKKYGITAMYFN